MTTPTVSPAHRSVEPGFPVAGPVTARATAPTSGDFPAAGPAVGLVELPDPADVSTSTPSELRPWTTTCATCAGGSR